MSCFIVSDKHLSAIARWACNNPSKTRQGFGPGQEQEAVNLLHAANVKSVNRRYHKAEAEDGATYDIRAPHLTPTEVLKACDCLSYQCDNWDGFESSDAYRFITDTQHAAIRQLQGYDAAQWSIE